MKTVIQFTIIFFAFLFPISAIADWNKPDKGCFKYKKDLEQNVSDFSYASSTIYFNGTLYNFINYNYGNKVIIRKIIPTIKADTINSWSDTKYDQVANLSSGLYESKWQPAPVVFDDNMLLFVSRSDGSIGYSVYDETTDLWSTFKSGPTGCMGDYMAAVTVLDKLCLIALDKSTYTASIYWTTDLQTWHQFKAGIHVGIIQTTSDDWYSHISAISKTWVDNNNILNNKIMLAYITSDQYVRVAEFAFDNTENLYQICDNMVANDATYTSAALAEGSVKGDPTTGICTQVFLKKAKKDNGYCRYRILRYQKKEGQTSWTKQENNLVPQNKLWADRFLDLTAVNFPFISTVTGKSQVTLKQFMCLIYRGYDDCDYPLNAAWAETDHLVYLISYHQFLSSPSQLQYLGYVEGPPPYYLNTPCNITPNNYYVNCEDENISVLEYSHTSGSEQDTTIGFDVERSVKLKVAGFNLGLSSLAGQAKGYETKVSESTSVGTIAGEDPGGYYICLRLQIIKDIYKVFDVHGDSLYRTYYFHLIEDWYNQPVPLRTELEPGHPETYMNDSTISYFSYDMFESGSLSWNAGHPTSEVLAIEGTQSVTSTSKGTAEFGKDFGEFLDLGVEGSFDYELKTTTMVSNEMTVYCRLNDPGTGIYSDVKALYYDIFWLQRTDGMPNWWLNEYCQDPGQQPWCLTYLVTMIVYANGDTVQLRSDFHSLGIDDILNTTTPLVQNRPNPFSSVTTISYRIGAEAGAGGNGPRQLATLAIYDLNGRLVATPVNETKAPGTYEVTWDASSYPAGIYLCRLQTDDGSYVRKLVVTR